MKSVRSLFVKVPAKSPTGITVFDEITGGSSPSGRTTLMVGGPGSGKTILALQFMVHGAQHCKEPGIFVAFEESTAHRGQRRKLRLESRRVAPKKFISWIPSRLHEWLLADELSGIITAKAGVDEMSFVSRQPFGFMQQLRRERIAVPDWQPRARDLR